MSLKIKGLDEFQKQLKQMEKAARDLENTHSVSFDELFKSSFMRKYTNFSNFDEFLKAGNFIVNSQEDFEAIPDNEMDLHVNKTTSFSSWENMLSKAGEEYTLRKLGFK
ncbi:hypothetical protein [Clostridium paraputrificum]|uniref:hypothetical protein n=1 Tax=Clostridium paraputrificum TaxID=29363 RepID=UPI0018A0DB92|nr:hypothetical protein [Clostridium paraputrificum]